jgi:hypothetical protein
MAIPTFNYTFKPMDYQTAQNTAAQQVDPLYNRAVQNVQQQKYQSDVQAGQVAAARGLGHSGLAADQLNKIAIAAQGQIGDISAQRATELAKMAMDLMQQDRTFGLQDRSQSYQEWMGQQNLSNDQRNFDYQKSQDDLANQWKQKEFDYQKAQDSISNSLKKSSGGGGGGTKSTSTSSISPSSVNTLSSALNAYNQAKTSSPASTALDQYYMSPVIQAVQNSPYADVHKYFSNPTPPAQSPYLDPWSKMKMFGL